jgi:hypothetical protein
MIDEVAATRRCGDSAHEGPRELPLTEFSRYMDGYQWSCKICQRRRSSRRVKTRPVSAKLRAERKTANLISHAVRRGPRHVEEDPEENRRSRLEALYFDREWRFRYITYSRYLTEALGLVAERKQTGGRGRKTNAVDAIRDGDHEVDTLEIERWTNSVLAHLRLGWPLRTACAWASRDAERISGPEDPPILFQIEPTASVSKGPRERCDGGSSPQVPPRGARASLSNSKRKGVSWRKQNGVKL